jgi:hypothetical protein
MMNDELSLVQNDLAVLGCNVVIEPSQARTPAHQESSTSCSARVPAGVRRQFGQIRAHIDRGIKPSNPLEASVFKTSVTEEGRL